MEMENKTINIYKRHNKIYLIPSIVSLIKSMPTLSGGLPGVKLFWFVCVSDTLAMFAIQNLSEESQAELNKFSL